MTLKQKPFRSAKYLAFVRQQPCMFCGMPADDAHHLIGLHWNLSGMGMTAPDSYAMGLCRHHHNEVHKHAGLQRQQPEWLLWTLNRGITHYRSGEIHDALVEAREFVRDRIREAA